MSICAFFAVLFTLPISSAAQTRKTDSLEKLLRSSHADTHRVNLLNALVKSYWTSDQSKALSYSAQAIGLASKLNFLSGLAKSHSNAGVALWYMGKYDSAMVHHDLALKLRIGLGLKQDIATSYNNIGLVHQSKGDYALALEYNLKSLQIVEELCSRNPSDLAGKQGLARSLNNIGNIYYYQNKPENAVDYYLRALKLFEELNDKRAMCANLSNIGNIYYNKRENDKALGYFQRCLTLAGELNDEGEIAHASISLGTICMARKEYQEAENYFIAARDIYKKQDNLPGLCKALINMGGLEYVKGNYAKAVPILEMGLKLARETGQKENIKEAGDHLYRAFRKLGDYAKALAYYEVYTQAKDSLLNESSSRMIAEMQSQYQSEKKEREIQQLKRDKENQALLTAAETRRQNIIIWSVIAILALALVFAFSTYRNYLQKQQANITLEEKNRIIEEKNQDITDSIYYAQRIQQAKLPDKEVLSAVFPDSFILFKPKDIVSGDFYFLQKQDHSFYMAAADCTGHGVPGALMSMVGYEKLNEMIAQAKDDKTILSRLNQGIKESLRQMDDLGSNSQDGMDVALCSFQLPVSGNLTLHYSGAHRPLWILRKDAENIEEIKATKRSIGGTTPLETEFETHTISLHKGDSFYIFSDGFADQFGGHHMKKITTRQFRQLLLETRELTKEAQGKHLENFLEQWKGTSAQIDDILVIGVRI